MSLANLPTLAEVQAARAGKPLLKPKTRLEEKADEKKLTLVDDKAFRSAVWFRDRNRCRVCGCQVTKTLELDPKRGEVHHLVSRRDSRVKFDRRNGVLVCLVHHQQLTRHQLHVVCPTAWAFEVEGKQYYLNADGPLSFANFPKGRP